MNMHAKLLLAGALSLCGFAVQAQSAADPDATSQDAPAATAQARADDDPHCLRHTGSLIVASQNARDDRTADTKSDGDDNADRGRCIYSAGRAYSRDDIERTGQTDLGRALQMLDPSVSLGH